jgi:hypothetical protein
VATLSWTIQKETLDKKDFKIHCSTFQVLVADVEPIVKARVVAEVEVPVSTYTEKSANDR